MRCIRKRGDFSAASYAVRAMKRADTRANSKLHRQKKIRLPGGSQTFFACADAGSGAVEAQAALAAFFTRGLINLPALTHRPQILTRLRWPLTMPVTR